MLQELPLKLGVYELRPTLMVSQQVRMCTFVIPAKAGIQEMQAVTIFLDPGFRRGDDFLRVHQH